MTRLRNVLQSRADRFRKKQEKNALHQKEENRLIGSKYYDDETQLTGECIRPQVEPDGVEPDGVSEGDMYLLQAKGTRGTMAETFSSSEEENRAFSEYNENERFSRNQKITMYSEQDQYYPENNRQYDNPAYEEVENEYETSNGVEVVNLARGSARSGRAGVDEVENSEQPKTIEFVDSEDGKVFEIPQQEAGCNDGLLQNVRSLDDTYNDECSKTLNTNDETLQDPYTSNMEGIDHMNSSDRFGSLQVQVEDDERYEEYDQGDSAPENIGYEQEHYAHHDNTELYDCDDGQMYDPAQVDSNVGQPYQLERDGTFFEQMRSVQSRGHLEMEPENWESTAHDIPLNNPTSAYLNRPNDVPASPQLEDPYFSDGNSSWEEGSFATGASRTLSRVDTACDDDDDDVRNDDDARTFDGTFDGTEYYSDDDSYAEKQVDRPFVRILKKFRDMNVVDEQSDYESGDEGDEEDYEDSKKRSRRRKPKSAFDRLGAIGMNILNETIDYAERQDRAPKLEGGTIINSFADLFSCGAPSGY
ncbi:unnamed protein product [Pseudo-nitzschia multistriata]|uniref:Uncharacterized protein n=1 Tax=Pseudo-nitzschia multistriata TaxID=183589 RepID=A0A448Z0J4_9STRA|nr:unnamed protein product [Pseudo-nitzschia multistriata]